MEAFKSIITFELFIGHQSPVQSSVQFEIGSKRSRDSSSYLYVQLSMACRLYSRDAGTELKINGSLEMFILLLLLLLVVAVSNPDLLIGFPLCGVCPLLIQ